MYEVATDEAHSFTPSDMARIALQNQEHTLGYDAHQEGDIVEIEGVSYRRTAVARTRHDRKSGEQVTEPYTWRTYYAHHDPVTGAPGPGWDSRFSLTDSEAAMRYHGRTFTNKQVAEPSRYMPETPYFELVPVDQSDTTSES